MLSSILKSRSVASLSSATRSLTQSASAGLGLAAGRRLKHTLPDLPYDYNALEPVISSEIMTLHHSKHHQTYVNNFNIAMDQLSEAVHNNDQQKVIALQPALRFNGGGHINHSIFWQNLCPVKDYTPPEGQLLKDIEATFGSLDAFITNFNAQTAAVQGSGWGWLCYDKVYKTLRIIAMPNQDPLEATTGLVPLLGVDVWEHAYYLDYKNVRPDYLKAIWQVVNWKDVAARYAACK
eukprot:Nk52_evm25s266 gene=Nk52_evmTU25s266